MFTRRRVTLPRTGALGALAALVMLVVVAAGHAGGGTPITACGQTVTTNAVLTKDLECTGDGIVVGASGITIDLKGFTVRGDRGIGDNGVDDNGYDDVTVKNGVLVNFEYGVAAYGGADETNVFRVLASGNVNDGIFVDGASASVKSSTASGNAGHGIYVSGDSPTVQSSTASGNITIGIEVFGSPASVKSSTASGNGTTGILVSGGPAARVQSSTASGNGNQGIYVAGEAAVITGNRAEANGFGGGLSDLFGTGIGVSGWFTTAPVGTNVARDNDDYEECAPQSLC